MLALVSALFYPLSDSVQELRAECYSQSRLATGRAPRAVARDAPSWMIIPPAFTPYTSKI